MKQIYSSIKMILTLVVFSLSPYLSAQCTITHSQNATDVGSSGFLWGQGFSAECDGNLEYVQLIASSTGTVSAGTLNIYTGNTVNGTPLYTQSHPSITINNINDPIRIDITGTLALTKNSQYTFEFTLDNVNPFADFGNGYPSGSAFQSGFEEAQADFIFNVSISDTTLSIADNHNERRKVSLFPNPSNDYITISNLQEKENYSIINALGQEVLKGNIINKEGIDIRNLNNGLYYLKLENKNTLKFIKE
ncbi:T9SS type A sorting domain-containing protein [Mariniflexile soesokkakense]|uniref:T9SS type A sorting domain-containing protein n=1 Tax=Mariniflexile soesokkakense TaxID=1343160 RepID=A0ABV0A6M4_9FLAO